MYLLFGLTLIIGLASQWYVSHNLKKYSKVACSWNITGADMAYRMSRDKQIPGVGVNRGRQGQDFFDPRTNAVTLGPDSYGQTSITAVATAVHEMGHAEQYATGYTFMKIRSAMVPVVNLASNAWMIVFFLGIFIQSFDLVNIGILLFAAVMAFQLVTLPVEFDASRRGIGYLKACGMNQVEVAGAQKVLTACALTYVAAALSSALQLIYLLIVSRD